jgi:hypothetical protein
MNVRKNYFKMQTQSFEIPLNKEKASIPKWLQQKLKQEGRTLAPKVYEPKERMEKPPSR